MEQQAGQPRLATNLIRIVYCNTHFHHPFIPIWSSISFIKSCTVRSMKISKRLYFRTLLDSSLMPQSQYRFKRPWRSCELLPPGSRPSQALSSPEVITHSPQSLPFNMVVREDRVFVRSEYPTVCHTSCPLKITFTLTRTPLLSPSTLAMVLSHMSRSTKIRISLQYSVPYLKLH
jgi:hypothetical protein